MGLHRCTEAECPYEGDLSPSSCGCHKTDEWIVGKAAIAMLVALKEGRRAIGDHSAPGDCYATGPLTGNYVRDLVQCPACSFIALHEAALAQAEAAGIKAEG